MFQLFKNKLLITVKWFKIFSIVSDYGNSDYGVEQHDERKNNYNNDYDGPVGNR